METEDNVEVGSNFHKNLILQSESLHKDIADEDGPTIRDYNDYVCYRRKRMAVIGIIVVVVLAAVSFTIVYFAHIHPKVRNGNQMEKCREGETHFRPVENKCFMYRDVQTQGIMFKGNAEECTAHCFLSSSCLSVDFFLQDGECWLFTVTSQKVLWEWTDSQKMSQLDVYQKRKLQRCVHYDRQCL